MNVGVAIGAAIALALLAIMAGGMVAMVIRAEQKRIRGYNPWKQRGHK